MRCSISCCRTLCWRARHNCSALAAEADCPPLCPQLQALLRHKSWDARVAAGDCLGRIAEHAAHPTPADLARAAAAAQGPPVPGYDPRSASELRASPPAPAMGAAEEALTLAGFDLARVLAQGTQLLASGGQVPARSGRLTVQHPCAHGMASAGSLLSCGAWVLASLGAQQKASSASTTACVIAR